MSAAASLRSILHGATRRLSQPVLGVALVGLLALVRLMDPAPIEVLRLHGFDLYQRLAPRPVEGQPVVIVDIDERSLARLGQWPWPRSALAELVDRIVAAGPQAVGLDILFPQPDRLSPGRLAEDLAELSESARRELRDLPSGDERLAAAIAGGPVVLATAGLTTRDGDAQLSAEGASKIAPLAIIGAEPQPFLPRFAARLRNLPEIEAAGAGIGGVSLVPGSDGIVRDIPLAIRAGDETVPALALEMLRVAAGKQSFAIAASGGGIDEVMAGSVRAATDLNGRLILHYRPHDPARFVSAVDLLDGLVDPGRLAGRHVLVGASATGLWDLRATPLGEVLPGVEIQAQALEILLAGAWLTRSGEAVVAELVMIVASGALLFIAISRIRHRWSALLLLGLAGGSFALSWTLFRRHGILLDATYPAFACAVVFLTQLYLGHSRLERHRRQLADAFAQYLSPTLVERLIHAPEPPRLGGEKRTMSIMFADIRNFTTLSERLKDEPERLTRIVHRLLTPMSAAVLEAQGTIDKYIGDCLMAFWNAPLDDPYHAAHACRAALDMQRRLAAVNESIAADTSGVPAGRAMPRDIRLRMGIGIATGTCLVGNLGSEQRFNYSVLGDPVNVAARLEAETKQHGVGIVICEQTRRLVSGFAALDLGPVRIKGRAGAIRASILVGDESLAGSDMFKDLAERHDALLAALGANDAAAAERRASECLAAMPELAELYTYLLMRDWTGSQRATGG